MHPSASRHASAPRAAAGIELRDWQRVALARLRASTHDSFLAVATPGAGKTTFALSAALEHLESARARVIVVVPTQHLKHQWADAAEAFGLHLDPEWAQRSGALSSDAHGAVLTYQQIATSAVAVRAMAERAFVILDEVHHAADTRAWGDALRVAFLGAARRLSLSGTPFRSDTNPIPFVRYEQDLAVADFEYSYGDALGDPSVVRPVYFPRVGGQMEWEAPDGSYHAQTFDDVLDRARSAQRLRTALSLESDWLPAVVERAHHQLMALRQKDPTAGGMVIATDQEHARGIAELLERRMRVRPVFATSDDPEASSRIARFRET
ncbi:MAG: DEAD/DEAH box helicase family protein, partial [Caldilineaceae bacterium]|nr:DEAD/DEAH box helicase family protein [Caldilineaceae bacterium]